MISFRFSHGRNHRNESEMNDLSLDIEKAFKINSIVFCSDDTCTVFADTTESEIALFLAKHKMKRHPNLPSVSMEFIQPNK